MWSPEWRALGLSISVFFEKAFLALGPGILRLSYSITQKAMSITLTHQSLKQFPPWVTVPVAVLTLMDQFNFQKLEGNRITSSFFAQETNSGNAAPIDDSPLPHGTGRGLRGSSTTNVSDPEQDQGN